MQSSQSAVECEILPRHIAIIMDGNGRWAKEQGKARIWGHKNGIESVRCAVRYCVKRKIQALTLFAFSSENWQRSTDEVNHLMRLFYQVLRSELESLHQNGVCLRIIGDRSRLSEKLNTRVTKAEEKTSSNNKLSLNIAINYGGRWDITQAAKSAIKAFQQTNKSIEELNEADLQQHLCLADQPPLDLMIRTGGDHRISNFLIWQAAYAELIFTDTFWPEFDEAIFDEAIQVFQQRERRFGKTSEQVKTTRSLRSMIFKGA